MAGWYVRRGEKVLGPISSTQLKEGYAAGKLLITDEIAKDPGGPWTEVRKTSLAPHAETRRRSFPLMTKRPEFGHSMRRCKRRRLASRSS
jgi:hypothetical protein